MWRQAACCLMYHMFNIFLIILPHLLYRSILSEGAFAVILTCRQINIVNRLIKATYVFYNKHNITVFPTVLI